MKICILLLLRPFILYFFSVLCIIWQIFWRLAIPSIVFTKIIWIKMNKFVLNYKIKWFFRVNWPYSRCHSLQCGRIEQEDLFCVCEERQPIWKPNFPFHFANLPISLTMTVAHRTFVHRLTWWCTLLRRCQFATSRMLPKDKLKKRSQKILFAPFFCLAKNKFLEFCFWKFHKGQTLAINNKFAPNTWT